MNLLQHLTDLNSSALPFVRLLLVLGLLVLAVVLEWNYPLRKSTQPKLRRVLTNLGTATLSTVLLRFSFYPMVAFVAYQTEINRYGLLPLMGITGPLGGLLSLIVLDATLYHWHWMLHKIPFLWRFHNVHHMDLDLDSSTALRFHFGELALSTIFRSLQILVFGITPWALALFEIVVTAFAQFHHANVRFPLKLEKLLSNLIITPRLHGIHHSVVRSETDSNFGTLLSWWDFLHGTRNSNVAQDEIVIGVPGYRDAREQGLWNLIWMPFSKPRAWQYPDGSVPRDTALSITHNK